VYVLAEQADQPARRPGASSRRSGDVCRRPTGQAKSPDSSLKFTSLKFPALSMAIDTFQAQQTGLLFDILFAQTVLTRH
jgi:hypothetical protein